ncbi:MAG: hypothetical protein JXA41_14495 [Deltaproteobacteria bacterium]|nr:hypothetical protein [Deltaproteobacteria bacterium]
MKKLFALFLSLLFFVTFSFAVVGCNEKKDSASEAPKVGAPAPAAEESSPATEESKPTDEEDDAADEEGEKTPETEAK